MSKPDFQINSISAIVVTFNSSNFIDACLSALNTSSEEGLEVIVVDNCSDDTTVDLVKRLHPNVKLIQNDKNLGFAGGVNVGAKLAKGKTLALINPDLVIQFSELLRLTNFLEMNEQIGIVSPCVLGTKRKMEIISAGRFPKNKPVILHWTGLSRLGSFNSRLEGHYLFRSQLCGKRQVDWVSGACLLITRDCWEKTGGLSDRWFMYAEDIDLCFKAKRIGFEIWIDPSVIVQHFVGGSQLSADKKVNSDWILNLFDFYVTRYKPTLISQIVWKMTFFTGLISRSFWFLFKSIVSNPSTRQGWRKESISFFTYSRAILMAPVSIFREIGKWEN